MMSSDNSQRESDRAVAFTVAVYEAYTAIQKAKRMARAGRARPKAMLRLIEDFETHLDTIYTEAGLRQTALQDVAKITQELGQAYDQVVNDAETAYGDGWQAGWEEALQQLVTNAPRGSGEVVDWLIHALQSGAAYQAPEWDGVVALIREAQRYLTANGGE